MSLSYPGFLLKGGTIYDLIRLYRHWELSLLLPVPPLGHIYSCMSSSAFTAVGSLLLFRLINRWVAQVLYNLISFHSRWKFSPLLPDPPLGHISLVNFIRFHSRWEFPPLPPVPPLGCTKDALEDSVSGPRGTL